GARRHLPPGLRRLPGAAGGGRGADRPAPRAAVAGGRDPYRAVERARSARRLGTGADVSRYAHPAGARHAEGADHGPSWLQVPSDVNALTPQVWAGSVERRNDGVLTIGGLDVRDLAEQYDTPAYILDEDDFRYRAGLFREAFG